uniref:TRCF domain-containing protein n=1 Tax=uncultured Planktosalinus sp. TaxID=1810935 RepID=UPI0030DAA08F
TYQKILAEAIEELKEKEFKDLYKDEKDKKYIKETVIDTDFEILFPDDYVNNITERLNLYNKLSDLKTEEALQQFEKELEDRFGELPVQVIDLLNSVRIKWIAIQMGLERVVMKQGKFVGYFIADQQSGFYQSEAFQKVLQFVQSQSGLVKIKEKQTRTGLRLLLSFEHVKSVKQALKVLERF